MADRVWVAEAPYQPSASTALFELQAEVLAEGRYDRPWLEDREDHHRTLVDTWRQLGLYDDVLAEMVGAGLGDTFDRLRDGGEPRDRVEAVLWSGDGGTGSVLDVEEAEPIERADLTRWFGQPHPDLDAVREADAALDDLATPDGRYLVAYTDGLPSALVFFGSRPVQH